MRKMICLLLILALAMGLWGCGKQAQTQEETQAPFVMSEPDGTFQVGFAKKDITPRQSVPLAGYGNTSMRMSTNVLRPLYVSSMAMRDGQGNTVIFMSIDIQAIEGVLETMPTMISSETGVPVERVILSATHSHAAPHMASSEPVIETYSQQIMIPQVLAAAKESLLDLQTATLSIGSVELERMNFVRHYQYIDENGQTQYFGDNFGTTTINETTTHTTQADKTMYILNIQREGKKDLVVSNWRAHPHFESSGSSKNISSDFVGAVSEALKLQRDCEFVYYQGAAGNVNTGTVLASERRTKEMAEYAATMAEYILECLDNNMTPLETGPIQTKQTMMEGMVNHATDIYVYQARAVQAVWQATNDAKQAIAAGGDSGIRSPYQANAIVSRSTMPASRELQLNAVTIGDSLAIVTAPCELFDTLSEMTEEGSPYQWTLTFGYSNDYEGYIPSAFGWEYQCYESDCSTYAPGTGEQITQCFLSMLEQLKGE